VHAKGSGAYGYFEVTEHVTPWTKAAFLSQVGKRTPVFLRFSTVAGEFGSADTVRDPRALAIKFYTEEGNYDLVGNNTPTFFVRENEVPGLHPLTEADERHGTALKRRAVGLLDPLAGVRPPGDDPEVRPRHPADVAPHERLLKATPTRGSTRTATGTG
jgi:hypothetical protein